jgi:hypothetical protein
MAGKTLSIVTCRIVSRNGHVRENEKAAQKADAMILTLP